MTDKKWFQITIEWEDGRQTRLSRTSVDQLNEAACVIGLLTNAKNIAQALGNIKLTGDDK